MSSQRILNEKDVMERHIEEVRTTVDMVEKSDSAIYPFDIKKSIYYMDAENLFTNLSGIVKEVERISSEDPNTVYEAAIFSVTDSVTHYKIVSVDMYGKLKINLAALDSMRFGKKYLAELSAKEWDVFNADEALLYVYKGFCYHWKLEVTDKGFMSFPVFEKLRYIREITDVVEGDKKSSRKIYFYAVRDVGVPRRIYVDARALHDDMSVSMTTKWITSVMEESESTSCVFPYYFSKRIPGKGEIDEGLSRYQSKTMNSFKGIANTVLGIAGSGKTYLAMKAMEADGIALLALEAHGKRGKSVCYAIHSDRALKEVYERNEFAKKRCILLNPYSADFRKKIAEKIERLSSADPEAVRRKLKEIEGDELLARVVESVSFYESSVLERKKRAFDEMISETDARILKKAGRMLRDEAEARTGYAGLLLLAAESLLSLFGKGSHYVYPNLSYGELKKIKSYTGMELSEIPKSEIPSVYAEYRRKAVSLLRRSSDAFKKFHEENGTKTVEIPYERTKSADLDVLDLRAVVDPSFSNVLSDLKSIMASPTKVFEKEYFESFVKAFPFVMCDLKNLARVEITEKVPFVRIHVDEGFLFPGFVAYSIMGKTMGVNVYGDMNQFDVGFYFAVRNMYAHALKIYGSEERFSKSSITVTKGGVKSFFHVAAPMFGENFSMLLENFRSTKQIVKAQINVNDDYPMYIKSYAAKEGIENYGEAYELIDVINEEDEAEILFPSGEKKRGSLWYTSKKSLERRLRSFAEIAVENGFSAVVTATFKSDITDIAEEFERMKAESPELAKADIRFIPMDSLQSMEFDAVHHETAIEDVRSEGYRFLKKYPSILNVALTRAKKFYSIYLPPEVLYDDFCVRVVENNGFQRY